MWPWEHAAFGYLLVSLYSHAVRGEAPDGRLALAAGLGAVAPDLVDKPLSWTLGVFPSGYAVAHSAFVFPAFAAALWLSCRRRGVTRLAVAYLVGHASHLAGDVIYPFLLRDDLVLSAVLWPLVVQPASPTEAGLVARTLFYLRAWAIRLRALDLGPLLVFELSLVGVVAAVWLYDGAPVLAECRAHLASRSD